MKAQNKWLGVGLVMGATCTFAGGWVMQLGPLEPPAGPVVETAPSLGEIRDQLDRIELSSTGETYKTFTMPTSEIGLGDQLSGTLIASGRVKVHAIHAYFAEVSVFDGAGRVNSIGIPSNGHVVGRCSHSDAEASNSGLTGYNTSGVDLDTVVENGLYAAWHARKTSGFVTVVYRELD